MYRVIVDDNFSYMRTDERWTAGDFDTFEAAVAKCRRIVQNSLNDLYKSGMTAEALYRLYTGFGDDPFVVTPPGELRSSTFSAWDFAKERAAKMCAVTPSPVTDAPPLAPAE
jgi:hypothetical protein